MADMDAHYAEEDLVGYERQLAAVDARQDEIAAFFTATGQPWDAWNWNMPEGDLIEWWKSVQREGNFCACGRVVSQCDGSRLGCKTREST